MDKRNEAWPFCMADSGAKLEADRYYGFSDSGGLCGYVAGYDTQASAVNALALEYGEPFAQWGSTKPEDLGGVGCCVLTGRQYVDRLYELCKPGGSGWELSEYGKWTARRYLLATNPPDSDVGYVDVLSWATGAEVVAHLQANDPAVRAGLTAEQEAAIHRKLVESGMSKPWQGRAMSAVREVLAGGAR